MIRRLYNPRLLVSKYESKCARCGEPIEIGDLIMWELGYSAEHLHGRRRHHAGVLPS